MVPVTPLVTVIIPTHNRVHLLREAVNSLCAQEGQGELFELEMIVIDDASTDETCDIVRHLPRCNIFGLSTIEVRRVREMPELRPARVGMSRF